jgi:NAD(P)-dependent dehydrogenase (short-subunit alcohol dehydrogenase family)
MTDIAGKSAVITGGATGIGMGIAKELARCGVPVAIADIMIDNARRTVGEIVAAGGKAIAIPCDVCERASIAAMREEAEAALGPIQLLFANAGATNFQRLSEIEDNDIDWLIQVNLMGVINTVKAFLPGMIAAGGGHMVATSSMAGLLPGWIPLHTIYSAAKLGIIGFMMNLAMEVKQHGVAVST